MYRLMVAILLTVCMVSTALARKNYFCAPQQAAASPWTWDGSSWHRVVSRRYSAPVIYGYRRPVQSYRTVYPSYNYSRGGYLGGRGAACYT
jgi:hypothetical protein